MSPAPRVALVDGGGTNIGSVSYALERLGASTRLTDDPATGRVRLSDDPGSGEVPRDDVAGVVVAVLDTPGTAGVVTELVGGDTEIDEAVRALAR